MRHLNIGGLTFRLQFPGEDTQPVQQLQVPLGLAANAEAGLDNIATYRTPNQAEYRQIDGSAVQGVIVPTADPESGTPLGVDPHDVRNVRVQIDTHLGGQGGEIRVADLANGRFAAAMQRVRNEVGAPKTMPATRLQLSAAMQLAAMGTDNLATASPAAAAAQMQAAAPPRPTAKFASLESFLGESPQPVAALAAAGSLGSLFTNAVPVGPTAAPMARPAMSAAPTIPAPNQRVHIDYGQGIELTAYYHDAVVADGTIVLIYDTRCELPPHIPTPSADPSNPRLIALRINDENKVYRAIVSPVKYENNSQLHIVLFIDQCLTLTG